MGNDQEYYDRSKRYKPVNIPAAIFTFAFVFAICGLFMVAIFFPELFGGSSEGNLSVNDNYKNLKIEFDDDETFASSLTYPERDTPTYKWAAAATSIYPFMSYGYEEYIGGQMLNSAEIDDCKTFLENAYNISDRDSAKKVIDRMLKYGHRARYKKFLKSD